MKRNNKFVTILTLLIVICSFFIAGWGKRTVELLDENLIDLNKAVSTSLSPAAKKSDTEASDSRKDREQADSPSRNAPGIKAGTERIKKVTIRIHGKEIIYDNEKYDTADALISELEKSLKGVINMKLQDDYAEAHKYREADEALRRYCGDRGYEYAAD